MILFCNLVSVYVHKICEDKFGGCRKSFLWLGQKVKKNRSMRMVDQSDNSSMDLWPWYDATNLKLLNIRVVFKMFRIFDSTRLKFQIHPILSVCLCVYI